jgi:hypothetical protein
MNGALTPDYGAAGASFSFLKKKDRLAAVSPKSDRVF